MRVSHERFQFYFWLEENFFKPIRFFSVVHAKPIDEFRNIKIQPKTIDLSARLLGINTEFVGFIPKSLALRSIVLG